jgi:hypothetical protein
MFVMRSSCVVSFLVAEQERFEASITTTNRCTLRTHSESKCIIAHIWQLKYRVYTSSLRKNLGMLGLRRPCLLC